jgi:hypothetical protein
LVAAGDGDPVVLVQQLARQGGSDSAGTTGDQRDLSVDHLSPKAFE